LFYNITIIFSKPKNNQKSQSPKRLRGETYGNHSPKYSSSYKISLIKPLFVWLRTAFQENLKPMGIIPPNIWESFPQIYGNHSPKYMGIIPLTFFLNSEKKRINKLFTTPLPFFTLLYPSYIYMFF
jgi:hypothetical protein